MTREAAKSTAWAKGYRRIVHMESADHDLLLWVRPDEDLDSDFVAYDAEDGERLLVNGWLFILHDGADERGALYAEFGDFRETA